MKTIEGFDYRAGRPARLTRREWRERCAERSNFVHSHGETLVYVWNARDKRVELDAQIYAQGVLQ